MSQVNSTPAAKPAKPTPDFPLFAHATKRWAKKIDGKLRYFGPWDDPEGALQRFLALQASKSGCQRVSGVKPSAPMGEKPSRPAGFPLFAHATGRWAKKIRGRVVYFGPWDDRDGALQKYLDNKDALHSGLTRHDDPESLTVFILCAKFLTTKKYAMEAGDLSARTFGEYTRTSKALLKSMGKNRLVADLHPDDFEKLRAGWVRKGWGPITISGEVQRVRTLFKHAYDSELCDKTIRFGPGFKKPSRNNLRKQRAAKGKQMFEPEEIKLMLKPGNGASLQMRAMILLAANCGFGNGDCGHLPIEALDLQTGWVNFPRPKTGIPRRCALWPETVAAVKAAIAKRPKANRPEDDGLVFITKYGDPWAKENIDNPIAKEFRKLLDKLAINGQRGFYCLRRGFEYVGGQACDQIAVDAIMGHVRESMGDLYRHNAAGMMAGLGVSDDRLRKVTDAVHAWLFGKRKKK